MRTTMTIDDDLYARLEELARSERRSIREVLHDLLRHALFPRRPAPELRVHHSALQPGLDVRRLNQLAEELEDDETLRRLAR